MDEMYSVCFIHINLTQPQSLRVRLWLEAFFAFWYNNNLSRSCQFLFLNFVLCLISYRWVRKQSVCQRVPGQECKHEIAN